MPDAKETIEKYPVILQGLVKKTGPENTSFEVKKVYKGNEGVGDKITLKQKPTGFSEPRKYDENEVYVLFLNKAGLLGQYTRDVCSLDFSLESVRRYPQNLWQQIQILEGLEMLNANSDEEKVAVLKRQSEDFPYAAEHSRNLAEIFARQQKYQESIEAYKRAFRASYVASVGQGRGLSLEHLAKEYDANYYTTDIGIADSSIVLGAAVDMLMPYGKVLLAAGKPQEAEKVFKIMQGTGHHEGLEELYQKALEQSRK